MICGSIIAVLIGLILDLMFGDPYWLPHLVRLMGRTIGFLEKKLLNPSDTLPKQKQKGVFLVISMVFLYGVIPFGILKCCYEVHFVAGTLLEGIVCWQMLAAKSLKKESMKVYESLRTGNVEQARHDVSMIVGRDTEKLTEEGIIRAAVETVAENTSDGVIAPLFYMIMGGGWLAMAYKAVNTMDSMVGYRNEKYLYFGCAAARTDDVVNFIPARLSAMLMIVSSVFLGLDYRNAVRIFKRDRYQHKSPNSAQTESVCAGALGVRLAGDAWYFGELCQKPYIGDAVRDIRTEDIRTLNRMMYVTTILGFLILISIKILIWRFFI